MTDICDRCDGTGEIDRPELYRTSGPPEDCDPPGAWIETCATCGGSGEMPDDIVAIDDWYEPYEEE